MPKLTNVTTKDSRDVIVNDNSSLKIKAEEIGVLFGCEDGKCGSCRVEVLHGPENISKITDREKDLGIEPPYRLFCQCKIKGDVTIRTQ